MPYIDMASRGPSFAWEPGLQVLWCSRFRQNFVPRTVPGSNFLSIFNKRDDPYSVVLRYFPSWKWFFLAALLWATVSTLVRLYQWWQGFVGSQQSLKWSLWSNAINDPNDHAWNNCHMVCRCQNRLWFKWCWLLTLVNHPKLILILQSMLSSSSLDLIWIRLLSLPATCKGPLVSISIRIWHYKLIK